MPFDRRKVPAALRASVERGMRDVLACEDAIGQIEAHLAQGRPRTPELLIALAVLLFRDASMLVLSEIEPASIRALALLDEAAVAGADRSAIAPIRAQIECALDRERRRARILEARVVSGGARGTERAEVVAMRWRRGDDAGARALADTTRSTTARSRHDGRAVPIVSDRIRPMPEEARVAPRARPPVAVRPKLLRIARESGRAVVTCGRDRSS